jgi:WD40 repeat protein
VAAVSGLAIILWDGATKKQVWATQPQATIRMLAFSPDRSRLAVVLQSNTVNQGTQALPYRELRTSDWQDVTPDSPRLAREVAYSPKGELAILSEERDPQNRLRSAIALPGNPNPLKSTYDCRALRFDNGGNLLASCPNREPVPGGNTTTRPGGIVRIVGNAETRLTSTELRDYYVTTLHPEFVIGVPSVSSFDLVRMFQSSTEFVRIPEAAGAFAVPANGDWIATGSKSGAVALWKIDRGFRQPPPLPFKGDVADLTFSHNERWLAVAERGGQVHIFDAASGSPVKTIDVKAMLVRPLFSPDDSLLALLGVNDVYLVETREWKPLSLPKAEKLNATSFSFGPDSSILLVAGNGKMLRYRTQPCCAALPDIEIAGTAITQLRISADRNWIAADSRTNQGQTNTAYFGSVSGKPVQTIEGQKLFSMWPSYDQEMTGDSEGGENGRNWTFNGSTVFEAESRSKVADLTANIVDNWAVSRKGNWIATASEGQIVIWPWSLNNLTGRACELLPRNLTANEWMQFGLKNLGLGDPRPSCEALPYPPDPSGAGNGAAR